VLLIQKKKIKDDSTIAMQINRKNNSKPKWAARQTVGVAVVDVDNDDDKLNEQHPSQKNI